ncbi:MAG TPA: NAD(P)H-dependent oxidoreductase subunit E [Thermoanaerobaculia bacterium]|nr:NAD(P)H-dependent oxidoreductase subunit E [Thermoanaerobaculia bacterium]
MKEARPDRMASPGPASTAAAAEGRPAFPPEARERLDQIRRRYPQDKAALIPALHIAQELWGGWLPEEAVLAVAAELGLPPAEVWGVVSFYDLFHTHPVGRHRLRVCSNLPCQLRGADEILEVLRAELGVGEDEVTADGRCSYVHFECLGSCDTAPMMMIDDRYEENLTPERVREILGEID